MPAATLTARARTWRGVTVLAWLVTAAAAWVLPAAPVAFARRSRAERQLPGDASRAERDADPKWQVCNEPNIPAFWATSRPAP